MFGQTTLSEMRLKIQMSVRKPHGVVGLITPWNFPTAIPSWKMMPAIITGNTVVLKLATFTPKLSIRLVEVLAEAGTAAIDFYTEWQSIYVDYSGKLQRAQIGPLSNV